MHFSDVFLILGIVAIAAWFLLSAGIVSLPRRRREPPKSAGITVQLPVSPRAKLGPVSCGTCEHFDREAGRRVIADHPIFVAATQAVAPWRMVATYDDEGNPTQQPSPEMLRTSWDDVGLCVIADENGNRECVMATCTDCPKNAYRRKLDA